jgi:hypothetical protein
MKALLVRPDGSEEEVSPLNGDHFTVKELQDLIGGYFTVVRTTTPYKGYERFICDEDGLQKELFPNPISPQIYDSDTPIVGNILLFHKGELM